jgi:membrane associated rhomboid family serine protease
MLAERDYMREERTGPRWSMTIVVLVINVIVFGLQNFAARYHPDFPMDDWFALSLQGLRHGFLWQLLTYQFMHAGFWHIFLNSWAIYVFGRVIESTMGKRRMLELYFLSGFAGGLLQMAGTWLFPNFFGNAAVVGASAGAFGLVAAFGVLFPNYRLMLLLFMVVPMKLKAKTMLWLSVALAVFGLVLPWFADVVLPEVTPYLPPDVAGLIQVMANILINSLFGNVAHAAHLGGIIMGFLLARQWLSGYRTPPVAPLSPKSRLNINPAPD